MENDGLLPFDRNQYYTGKSLSAIGLAAEQRYFNDKRRLLNMASFGFGVLFGLTVTKLDGRSIIVGSGLAIDPLGRELVIDEQAVVQLSDLEGFNEDADGQLPYAYLCLEYAEEDISPTHAMVEPTQAKDHFDMKREGYRLFISYGEPDADTLGDRGVGFSRHAGGDSGLATQGTALDSPRQAWRDIDLATRLDKGSSERLYLARIHIIRFKDAYDIDDIENLPFAQYASSASLLDYAAQNEEQSGVESGGPDEDMFSKAPGRPIPITSGAFPPPSAGSSAPRDEQPSLPSAYGLIELNIPPDVYPNTVLYSTDIVHGLGLVGVRIELALEVEGGAIFGDSAVFAESWDYAYAAKADERSGTFRIGVRVNTTNPLPSLRLRWKAELDPSISEIGAMEPQIIVTPSAPVLKVREAVQFTATVYGVEDKELIWEVGGEGHGDILNDGYYTAPNTPGVYEAIARLARDTTITGVAIITVKEYSNP